MSNEPEDYKQNFAMIIPLEAFNVPEKVIDPNGAPIYAGCEGAKSEWGCACTGACKKIVGYSQDPEKIAAYHESIRQYNENRNKPIEYFRYGEIRNEGGVRIWERKNPNEEL